MLVLILIKFNIFYYTIIANFRTSEQVDRPKKGLPGYKHFILFFPLHNT
jgi:hypothetical protein